MRLELGIGQGLFYGKPGVPELVNLFRQFQPMGQNSAQSKISITVAKSIKFPERDFPVTPSGHEPNNGLVSLMESDGEFGLKRPLRLRHHFLVVGSWGIATFISFLSSR